MSEIKNIWVSVKENEYLINKGYESDYSGLEKTLTQPRFTISQLGITARDATYWDKQGILPELKGSGTRRKYDLIQSIWIRLIPQMRRLGIGVPTIKLLKENIFQFEVSAQEMVKSEEFKKQLRDIVKNNEKDIEAYLESEEFKGIIDNETFKIFDTSIMYVILFKKRVSLIVNEKGYFTPYSVERHNELVKANSFFNEALSLPHFSLSLSEAYTDLVNNWKEEPFFEEISIVSEDEMKVLSALRKTGLKSVTIRYKGGEMDLLESVQEQEIDLGTRFMDVISKNGFHTVTIKSRNGQIVNYENKVLKKINRTR